MFFKKQKPKSIGYLRRQISLFVVIGLLLSGLFSYTRVGTPEQALAATSSNLNIQARLYNASGSVVSDGYYNIEFKMYDAVSAGSLLWTESWYDTNGVTAGNDNRVRVVNGYMSVQLGTHSALPSVNWDDDIYISLNVGGTAQTATPTYDGEMSPRIKLTSVPFAQAARNLRSGNTSAASTNSGNISIQTGNAAGTTSNSGNVTLDVGTATGTAGTISVGTANTSGITIGRVGVVTDIGGNLTISGSQFTNNGSTLNGTQALGDFPAGGAIGSAATTVDVDTGFAVAQTTAGQTLSLPNPTSSTAGRIVYVLNTGSASFNMHGVTIPASYGQIYIWNGSNWRLGASGGGAAITLQAGYDGGNTITTTDARDIDFTLTNTATDANFTVDIATGSTGEFKVQANGTDVLQIGSAGQLQLDTQGITGGILLGGDTNLYRSAANTLRTDDDFSVNGNVTIAASTGNITTSGDLAVNGGDVTSTGSLTISSAASSGLNLHSGTDGTVDIDSGTTGAITIGTASSDNLVAIGNANGTSSLILLAGTGGAVITSSDGVYLAADDNIQQTADSNIVITNNDSATAFQVQSAGLTPIFTVDATSTDVIAEFNLAVNGNALTSTNAGTFSLLNTNVATLNIGGAVTGGGINFAGGSGSTGCTINGSTGFLTCSGDFGVNGGDITTSQTTFNIANATATSVGAFGAASTISIGAAGATITGGGALTLQSGGTNTALNLYSNGTGGINLGTNATNHITTVGSTSGTSTLTLQGGTNGINISTGGIANTIQIGNTSGAVTQTINIGNNSAASSTNNVNIGSSIAGTTAIQGATTITNRTSGSAQTLVVNNSTSTGSIFTAQDNGTAVLTVSDGGAVTFKSTTNNTDIFNITNSAGDGLVTFGTAFGWTANENLILNSNIENVSTGWSGKNGGTASLSGNVLLGSHSAYGQSYLNSTVSSANDGAYYDITLLPSTAYTLSAYVRLNSGSDTTLTLGRQDISGSDVDCAASATISGNWQRISCTFTTGGTISSSNVYIKQTDAVSRTLHIDAIQLEQDSSLSAYNMGRSSINAPLTHPLVVIGDGNNAAYPFQVQNGSGTVQFAVDGTSGGTIVGNDLAVNGGDITSTATTFNLLNTTATTINAFGAATTLSLGAGSGTTTVNNNLTVTGLLTANGNLTLQTGDTFTINGDALTDLTGSGLTVSGNALTVDTTSATGFFRNGGNSFAGAATLGTNDANVLNLETGGTNRFQISSTSSILTGQGATFIEASSGGLFLGNTTLASSGIAIGSGSASSNQLNIGNTSASTGVSIQGGTGSSAVSISAGSGGYINIGTVNNNAINIGDGTTTGAITIGGGSTTGTITLGQGTGNSTIDIGKYAGGGSTQTINIGNSSTASSTTNVNIGSQQGGTTAISGNLATRKGTDYSTVAGNNAALGNASLVRLTGASAQTITGIASGTDGRRVTLLNASGFTAVIANNNVSSSAANRITTGTGADINLTNGSSIELIYDSTDLLWRVTGSSAFSMGSYIQNGTTQQTSANFNIKSASAGSVGAVIQGTTVQTADILQLKDENGDNLLSVGANAGFAVQSSNGFTSTSAFSVGINGGATIFRVNSTTPGVYTGSTSFNVFNDTATTINAFGAATTLSLGAGSGTTTVNNNLTVTGLLTANGNLTLQTGDTFTINGDALTDLTGSGLTLSGTALTVDDSTATGFIRNGGNTFGSAATIGTNDNTALNLETANTTRFVVASNASKITGQGTTEIDSTGALFIGGTATNGIAIGSNSVGANEIAIGNTTAATFVNIQGGTGTSAVSIQAGATGDINIGTANSNDVNINTAAVAGTTIIGGTTTTGTITLGRSTESNIVSIGTAATALSASQTQTVNIGNGTLSNASSAIAVNILSGAAGSSGTASLLMGNNDRVTQIDIGNVAADAARTLNFGTGDNIVGVDTLNIGTGNTTVANGKTINIGTGTPTGSGTNLITMGSLAGASTTTIQGGTGAGGILLRATGSSSTGIIVKNDNNSTAAFQIQNTSSVSMFTADTTNSRITIGGATGSLSGSELIVVDTDITGKLRVGDGTNGISFNDQAAGLLRFRGTARNDIAITLSPEYPGAVLFGDGSSNVGTMTSDFCSGSSLLNLPTSSNPCSASADHNYYNWTANATNDYDIWVKWKVPSDFSAFGTTPVQLDAYKQGSSDAVQIRAYKSGSGTTACDDDSLSGTGWGLVNSDPTTSCSFAAGETVMFRITLSVATNNNIVRSGEITINYKSQF